MRKRLLSLCITFLLLALLIPMEAEAATQVYTSKISGASIYWSLYSDGTLAFTGSGAMPDYAWDNSLGRVNSPWHNYCTSNNITVTAVTIGDGITTIGEEAFDRLTGITSVTIPDSVLQINMAAFRDCDSLKSVTLPGVRSIGYLAFAGCDALETININSDVFASWDTNAADRSPALKAINVIDTNPNFCDVDGVLFNKTKTILYRYTSGNPATSYTVPDTVTLIYDFSSSKNLTTVILPTGLGRIYDGAFEECSGLTSIQIPEGITSIGGNTFAACTSLSHVIFPTTLRSIGTQAFSSCSSLQTVDLPEGLRTLGMSAFSSCRIRNIVIPSTVTSIADQAFMSNYPSKMTVLSKNCTFGERMFGYKLSVPEIHGWAGSTAETYAAANSITFTEHNPTEKLSTKVEATCTATGIDVYGGCSCGESSEVATPMVDHSYTTKASNSLATAANCTYGPKYYVQCDNCDAVSDSVTVISGEAVPRAHNFVDGSCEHCGILGGSCGDTAWWILDNQGNMTIYGEGSMKSYRWSDAPWIEHADNFKTLVVESGITNISFNAFGNCTELASVSLPETVEEIASSAFANCSNLAEINIPDTVTTLEPAFPNCSSLTSITIPEGITQIGNSSFSGCTSLASVTLPSTVTVIADYAFNGCSSLVSITLPDGLTEIGRFAFQNCASLTSLELPESLTSIGAVAFCGCSSLTEMAVPEGITTIDADTFQDCTGIETLILPASVTTINQDAFLRCTPTEVFFGGTKSAWNFRNAPYANYVHYETTEPEGHWYAYTHDVTCTEAGYTCTACDCGYETNKTVTDAAPGHNWLDSTCVSPRTCSVCGTTSGNPVPGKHTYENYVCKYCGITLGGQCGDDAWWTLDADGLLTITGQGDMWDYAWNGRPWISHDDHIQTIVVEDGITSVGEYTFCHADNLTDVTLAESVISIGYEAFLGCERLESLVLPNNLKTIEAAAFEYTGLREVNIPNSVSVIDGYAFRGCSNLTKIRIPTGVTVLSNYTFRECSNLVSVELPEGLTSIGEGAFFECGKLESLSVPASVTSIGKLAFSDCSALECLVFHGAPAFSTDDVFRYCWNLADVYYAGTAEEWPELGEFFEEWSTTFLHYECTQPEGHWEPHVQDADCTEDGYTAEICACGHERNKQITDTAPGHDWTDATCTAPKTCKECGAIEGTALAHPFAGGKCTVCGADDPNYVPPATDPGPTEPKPTEPEATEPKPTEPEVTEPKPTEPAPTEPDTTHNVIRLAGKDRFETSFLVAEQMKEVLGKPRFDAIVLASGTNFADALSGSYLAAAKNAPILLGYKGEYNMQTILYIHANLEYSGTVYILGGEKAVSKEFDEAFETLGIKYVRLAGADRFETNLMVLREAGIHPGDEILVCTGTDFADSLSGSATGLPILLVYKKLTDNQKAYLATLNSNSFCVVGGENAVSSTIEQAISDYGPVDRLAGSNRLLTSVLVAQRYFSAPDSAVVAYGWNFPDGLCGGPLAYTMGSPLILTHYSQKHYAVAADYTSGQQIRSGCVLGGDGLVGDEATRAIFSMDPQQTILRK